VKDGNHTYKGEKSKMSAEGPWWPVINNVIFTHVIQMWRMGVSRLRLI